MGKGSIGTMVVVMSLAALLGSACGVVGGERYAKLSPTDKALYNGTQAGYHRLSPYFATSVSGGAIGDRVMKLYHHPHGAHRQVLIGTLEALVYESANYGPREQHFGISADGRSLLYFHEQAYEYGQLRKPNGLYLFREGGGDSLVRTDGLRAITEEERVAYLGSDR